MGTKDYIPHADNDFDVLQERVNTRGEKGPWSEIVSAFIA